MCVQILTQCAHLSISQDVLNLLIPPIGVISSLCLTAFCFHTNSDSAWECVLYLSWHTKCWLLKLFASGKYRTFIQIPVKSHLAGFS